MGDLHMSLTCIICLRGCPYWDSATWQACWDRGRARMTRRQAVGNIQTMTGVPAPTLYHRCLAGTPRHAA
jgi:hypothetical protein